MKTRASARELKRLPGVSQAGRPLSKPVYHYSLSWVKEALWRPRARSRGPREALAGSSGGSRRCPFGRKSVIQISALDPRMGFPHGSWAVLEALPEPWGEIRRSPNRILRRFTVRVVGIPLAVQGAFLAGVKVLFDTPCKPNPAAFTVGIGIVAVGRNHPPSLYEVRAMHFADIARSQGKGWPAAQSRHPPLASDDHEIGIVGNPIHRREKTRKDGFVNRVGWRHILTRDHGTGDQKAAAQECY